MRTSLMILSQIMVCAASVGCQAMIRDADQFEKDTGTLLATKNDQVKQCYEQALKSDPKLGGNVGVHFMIQKETGKVMDAKVDPALTTAPDSLQQCVLTSLDGLLLAPPDTGNDGLGTWVYEFKPNPQKQAPPEAAASADAAKPKG
jgi:hypothetical protein